MIHSRKSIHSGLILPETVLYISSFQDGSKWNSGSASPGFDIFDWSIKKNDLTKNNIDDDSFHKTLFPWYSFDGVNDFLNNNNNIDFAPETGDMSFGAVFKTGADIVTPQAVLMRHIAAPGNSFYNISLANSNIYIFFIPDGIWPAWYTHAQALAINTWYTILVSIDRNGNQFCRINGSTVGSQTSTNVVNENANVNFCIGSENGANKYFKNLLCEAFVIKGKALTVPECQSIEQRSMYKRLI